jgi:hypothetical protein
MPDEFGLLRPSANARPAPTEKRRLRRRRPTPGASRLERPISIGAKAFGQRPACADRRIVFCVGQGRGPAHRAWKGRFQSARKPSANGRPAPTEERRLRRRRPTLGASRLERPISIGEKAFGQRSACADRKTFPASAKADARRASACRGRFQSARRPSANARPAPTEKRSLRRRRPTPGASRLGRPISIGGKAFSQRPACAGQRRSLRRRRPTPGASRPERPISIGAKVDGPCLTRRGPARP